MPDRSRPPVLPEWNNAYRIINSAFPPISVFEDTLNPDDLGIAFALESLTNDRLRDQAGVLNRVRPEDRLRSRFRCRARIFAMSGMKKHRQSPRCCT